MKNKVKDPLLKIRYVRGLGDLVACILHSKLISPITYLITKQKTPCQTCQKRRFLLNELFPMSTRWLFFKSVEDQRNAFIKEAREFGYDIVVDEEKFKDSFTQENVIPNKENVEEIEEPIINNTNQLEPEKISESLDKKYDGYFLIKSTESNFENLKIVTHFFKKIDKV